jgi:hypothetical protein
VNHAAFTHYILVAPMPSMDCIITIHHRSGFDRPFAHRRNPQNLLFQLDRLCTRPPDHPWKLSSFLPKVLIPCFQIDRLPGLASVQIDGYWMVRRIDEVVDVFEEGASYALSLG